MIRKFKATFQYFMFALALIQAMRGWFGLFRDLALALKDAITRRRR